MKPPKATDPPFVVVVETDRVPLSDETRASLVPWVEHGGVILFAGDPDTWPKEFASPTTVASTRFVHALTPASRTDDDGDDGDQEEDDNESKDDADDANGLILPLAGTPGRVAHPNALVWAKGEGHALARFEDGKLYAGLMRRGEGRVLAIPNDDLFTNAGLAVPDNPQLLVRILATLHVTRFRVAGAGDGVSPPDNPLSALIAAGLGKALAHAPFAIALLFLAVGWRFGRPTPQAPPARRAFAEHVAATGALYARTRVASHALRAYARYADTHLRSLMPRGTSDIAAFVAARTSLPADECARIWRRATESLTDGPAIGDELLVLKDLSRLVAHASRRD